MDGSFLQSEALVGGWDEVIYLDASYPTAVERALSRDAGLFGSPEGTRAAYATRYHAACDLYLAERSPKERATIVVDNNDLENPRIVRGVMAL